MIPAASAHAEAAMVDLETRALAEGFPNWSGFTIEQQRFLLIRRGKQSNGEVFKVIGKSRDAGDQWLKVQRDKYEHFEVACEMVYTGGLDVDEMLEYSVALASALPAYARLLAIIESPKTEPKDVVQAVKILFQANDILTGGTGRYRRTLQPRDVSKAPRRVTTMIQRADRPDGSSETKTVRVAEPIEG